jgi:hypothetical protein
MIFNQKSFADALNNTKCFLNSSKHQIQNREIDEIYRDTYNKYNNGTEFILYFKYYAKPYVKEIVSSIHTK